MNVDFLRQIQADFPEFQFEESSIFKWSPEINTIFFERDAENFEFSLLHELGHALCGHADFLLDIQLVKMETEAWVKAQEIAAKYRKKIPQDFIENHLDTYRDWIHMRSLCPNCLVNGYQRMTLDFHCPACNRVWTANDSRFKSLRRKVKKAPKK